MSADLIARLKDRSVASFAVDNALKDEAAAEIERLMKLAAPSAPDAKGVPDEPDGEWRISKSGFSIKTGWGDDKRIIASYPGGINMPLNSGKFDSARFEQWMVDAEQIVEQHNAEPVAIVSDGYSGNGKAVRWKIPVSEQTTGMTLYASPARSETCTTK